MLRHSCVVLSEVPPALVGTVRPPTQSAAPVAPVQQYLVGYITRCSKLTALFSSRLRASRRTYWAGQMTPAEAEYYSREMELKYGVSPLDTLEKMVSRNAPSRTQQLFKAMIMLPEEHLEGFLEIMAHDTTPGHLLTEAMVVLADFPSLQDQTIEALER